MKRVAGLVGLMICLFCLVAMAKGDTTPSQCQQERKLLEDSCKTRLLLGLSPSATCCQHVRVTHVECVCPKVTPKLANLINVQRTIKQIEGCGRTVPRNFKCGSEF